MQETGGLISELQRIAAQMPGPDSEGMRVPDVEQMLAWGAVVEATSRNDLDTACRLIAREGFPYQVVEFTDLPNQSQRVLMLRENLPVTTGWGTYVLRPDAARDLLIEVPHPLADSRTRTEGAVLFRSLSARALLVAGAHRCANAAPANCGGTTIACGQVGPYRESDVAHATRTMFQAGHQALAPCDGESLTIQLHGNSLGTCPDLFISNGSTRPGEVSRVVYREARRACPDRSVDLADGEQGECGFYGNGAEASYHALVCRGLGHDRLPGHPAPPRWARALPLAGTVVGIAPGLRLPGGCPGEPRCSEADFPAPQPPIPPGAGARRAAASQRTARRAVPREPLDEPARIIWFPSAAPRTPSTSHSMAQLLERDGFRSAASPEEADVVLVNTCGFIGPAREESLDTLRELAAAKRPGQLLIAAGCLTQRYGAQIAREVPGLDGLLGTRRWMDIVGVVERARRTRRPALRPARCGDGCHGRATASPAPRSKAPAPT